MKPVDDEARERIERMVTSKLGARAEMDATIRSEQGSTPTVAARHEALPTITLAEGASGATLAPLEPGPEFALVQELGSGGMGVVMLARQRSLQRDVAIKITRFDHAQGADAVAALMEEALITGGLEHPNVIPVHAFGRDPQGRPVLVMKRVAGQSWRELLLRPRESSVKLLLRDPLAFHLNVLIQVSNALHFAHSRGVVHRDLKPENVMIGAFGEIYLLDWGISWRVGDARPGRVNQDIVGTLGYMAPEMLLGSGAHLGPRTDVYLLGAVLHQVLTHTHRHKGANVSQYVQSILQSEPVRYADTVPRELAELCNRATSREPEKRPASAQEFREALELFLVHRSSVQLYDESAQRYRQLRAALEAPKRDAQTLQRLFAECRFGLQQALRIWEENEDARELLREALARMCEFELGQRRLASAEALLAELDPPPAYLVDQVQRLGEELRAEQERLERLASLEHELDSRVSARQRVLGTLLSGVLMSGSLGALAVLDARGTLRLNFAVGYATLGLFSVGSGLYFFFQRRALLRTRFNRDLMGALAIAVASVFVATLCAQQLSLAPRQAVALVMLCMAVLQAALGVLAYRAFLGAALCNLLGTLVALFLPQVALAASGVALLLAHSYMAWRWSREGDKDFERVG